MTPSQQRALRVAGYVGGAIALGLVVYDWVDDKLSGRDGWPDEGDQECALSVYQQVLGQHGMKTSAERAWQYMPLARYAAEHFGVDPTLLAGLITTESGWNPTAGSSAGAYGLTQYIPSSAVLRYKKLVEQGQWPFDALQQSQDPAEDYFAGKGLPNTIDRSAPKQAVWLAAAALADALEHHDVEWALAAYNGGPGVANAPRSSWPSETQAYVPGVLKRQRWFQELAEACA